MMSDDGCTCKRVEWDESCHEIHRAGCPATLAPEDRPVTDEPMVERLEALEAMPDATFPHNWCITGPSTIPGDRVYVASRLSEANAKAIVAALLT